MIVHGTYQALPPGPGQPADGPVREVMVEAATYEEAHEALVAAVAAGERLLGIRVEGRAERYRQGGTT
jgi:hypothetical protein